MGSAVSFRVDGRWWAVDANGRWLVLDDSSGTWHLSDTPPEGEPEEATGSPPVEPPAVAKVDHGVASLRRHERELFEKIVARISHRLDEEIVFATPCLVARGGVLGTAGALLGRLTESFRAPRPMSQDDTWATIVVTPTRVHVFACDYSPATDDLWDRRRDAWIDVRDEIGSCDRSDPAVEVSDGLLFYTVQVPIGGEIRRFDAPKGDRAGRELARLLGSGDE